jgi:hypothetical protein
MENLAFRTIKTDKEIDRYLERFENYVGVKLPLNYAKNSEIVGVFLHEQLVGGYMLVTKPDFRSLLFVPDSIKRQNSFFAIDEFEMMEVNGLWISPALKTARLQFSVWIKLMKDVFFSRKKYILLMSDSRNKNIEYIHGLTNPQKLYEGAPLLMAGEKSHQSIRVSFTTRWSILVNLPKYWIEYRKRAQRAKAKYSQRNYIHDLKQSSTEMA